ncbi:MAG: hypothetical protein HY554_16110 [Elusimicrobia bacterium]|nr:hypothetical protein [Elusimicrobiota bacterium]
MEKVADFSRDATKKAVLKATLEHPVTLYSAGVGILGALAMGLFGATALPVAATVGGLGVGMGSWLVNYLLRGGTLADRHVKRLYEELERRRREVSANLEKSLQKLARESKGELHDYAEQGAGQFSMAHGRFQTLQETLRAKLNPGELTYGRYLGAAEQVYLSVLDNLSVMASMLQSVAAIDPKYNAARLKAVRALPRPQPADLEEAKTLEERDRLLKEKLQQVNVMLTQNEVAITEMDKLGASLAELRVLQGGAPVDLDGAIRDMEELARQAHRYQE